MVIWIQKKNINRSFMNVRVIYKVDYIHESCVYP